MSTTLSQSIEALDAILMEAGLLMHQVSQGSAKSAAAVDRICVLAAADVQQRVREIARQAPTLSALRKLQARRAMLGAFEFNLRRARSASFYPSSRPGLIHRIRPGWRPPAPG
jgi:hypothetical protein